MFTLQCRTAGFNLPEGQLSLQSSGQNYVTFEIPRARQNTKYETKREIVVKVTGEKISKAAEFSVEELKWYTIKHDMTVRLRCLMSHSLSLS